MEVDLCHVGDFSFFHSLRSVYQFVVTAKTLVFYSWVEAILASRPTIVKINSVVCHCVHQDKNTISYIYLLCVYASPSPGRCGSIPLHSVFKYGYEKGKNNNKIHLFVDKKSRSFTTNKHKTVKMHLMLKENEYVSVNSDSLSMTMMIVFYFNNMFIKRAAFSRAHAKAFCNFMRSFIVAFVLSFLFICVFRCE